MAKKPNGNNYSRLSAQQKEFIEKKAAELRSRKAVERYYNKTALVDRYAKKIARETYKS